MDRQEITLLVLLNLSAAFDQILLNVLENDFGIVGSAHKWFASYLSGRKQRVLINDHKAAVWGLFYLYYTYLVYIL